MPAGDRLGMSRDNTVFRFLNEPSIDHGLEILLDPLRHRSAPQDAQEPTAARRPAVSIAEGWRSWLPPSPAPLDGACQIMACKDPWHKDPEKPSPSAARGGDEFVVVGQTAVDACVYAIPGVVGGIALVDSFIADADADTEAGAPCGKSEGASANKTGHGL